METGVEPTFNGVYQLQPCFEKIHYNNCTLTTKKIMDALPISPGTTELTRVYSAPTFTEFYDRFYISEPLQQALEKHFFHLKICVD